tara:strand:+ start:128 stop:493 length:366 start_codon:yes stop_codon:yes gene_type:complete
MSKKLTLEVVKVHFNDWRKNNKRGSTIPDHLWAEAIALVGPYKTGEIVKTLRLSGGQFAAKREMIKTETKAAFIELKTQHLASPQISTACSVIINKTDGNSLTINTVSEPQLEQLLSVFLR